MAKELKGTCVWCESVLVYERGTKPEVCPNCGKDDWKKPPIETTLFILQKNYLKHREIKDAFVKAGESDLAKLEHEKANKYLGDMFVILKQYAKGKTKNIIKGVMNYPEYALDEVSSDSANCIIEYYLTKPAFKIDISFGGYLDLQIKSVLYNKSKKIEDNIFSLNDYAGNTKCEKIELNNFEPVVENSLNFDYLFKDIEREDVLRGVHNELNKAFRVLRSNFDSKHFLKVLFLFLFKLSSNPVYSYDNYKKKLDKMYGKTKVEQHVDRLFLVIRKYLDDNKGL